jgi:transposase
VSRNYRPRSTPAQRASAVALYESSGRPASAVAAELGVPVKTLESWIRAAKRSAIDPAGTMPQAQLQELQRLRRENELLQREVAFLKKADAFFRERDHGMNGMP